MKRLHLLPFSLSLAALLITVAAVPAVAQADPDIASAQGSDPMPAGWQVRLDRSGASRAALRFVAMDEGMHISSGPAAIYWHPGNLATGAYAVEATFTQTKAPMHAEAFGLIWAGKDLAADNQSYMYFIVRGDGKYMVKHRAGAETHEVVPWTEHAGVGKQDESGAAKTTLRVEVTDAGTRLFANGQLLSELPKSGVTAQGDGIVGLRVNHNLDVHVTGLVVDKWLDARPSPASP